MKKMKKYENGWSFYLGGSTAEIYFRWWKGKGLRVIIQCRKNWLIRLTGFNQLVLGV